MWDMQFRARAAARSGCLLAMLLTGCQDRACDAGAFAAPLAIDSFVATIHYEVESPGSGVERSVTRRTFAPATLGLRGGNGGLYAGLTSTLLTWAHMEALNHAAHRLGGLSQVRAMKVCSIVSGGWSVELPLSAAGGPASVNSPYDEPARLDRFAPTDRHAWVIPLLRGHESVHLIEAGAPHAPVESEMSVDVVFGDCIVYEPREIQMLATASPAASARLVMPMVRLQQALRESGLENASDDIRACYMDEYFWRSVRASSIPFANCASIRAAPR